MVSLFKKIATKVVKTIAPVMNPLTAAFVHPIQTAKAIISPTTTVKQVSEAHLAQPLKTQITQTVLAGVGYVGAVLGGAAVGGAAKAGTLAPKAVAVAKSLIPTTLKGKAIAAVAAPVVIGAVVREPAAVAKTLTKAPSELAQFGGDIATLATAPSLESAKQVVKESPLLTAAAGLAVVGAGAAVIAPAVSGYLTRQEMEKQTEAFERQAVAAEAGRITVVDKSAEFGTLPYTPETMPTTAKTEIVKEGVTKQLAKRRKRVSKPVLQPISQRVNVVVQNRSNAYGIKNYLKREVLLA